MGTDRTRRPATNVVPTPTPGEQLLAEYIAAPHDVPLHEIERRLEAVLREPDLSAMARGVEAIMHQCVTRSASPRLLQQVALLLEARANESSNRILSSYLRSAATCVREHHGAAAPCIDKLGEANALSASDNTRGLTRLGQFFHKNRSKEPSATEQGSG